MAIDYVTGSPGTPHVDGDDVRQLLAGVVGTGSYVTGTESRLRASVSGLTVTVAAGTAVHHGGVFHLTDSESVTLGAGTSGYKRNDLVCLKYARSTNANGMGVETASLAVIRGTPTTGTAADPTVPSGNVLSGASEDWMPLYRVSLNGTTAGTPVALFDVLVPAAEVWGKTVSYPSSSDPKIVVSKAVTVGSITMVGGYVKAGATGWFNSKIAGIPLPTVVAGVSFARSADGTGQMQAHINTDGEFSLWIPDGAAGYNRSWSAVYIS